MKKMIREIIIIWLICFSPWLIAGSEQMSLDLQEVSTQDALHILSRKMHKNIILSPDVTGMMSVHLQNVSPEEVFTLLLTTHNLGEIKLGKTWFIAPKSYLLQQEQEKIKIQTASDETAPLLARVWQIRYAKAEDIARMLQENTHALLSKRGQASADTRTNRLCVRDIARYMPAADHFIRQLDIPVQQVLIETRLASVNNDVERELGIQFSIQPGANAAAGSASPGRYSLAVATLADGSLLDLKLAALEREGRGELISAPSLFTANQQPASIEAGEEIPYQEVSESGGTAVAFKKAVLSLKVTPQILPGNKVMLQLQINQDRPSNRIVMGVPAISTRQIVTSVLVENGKTIVLGGIFESSNEKAEHRVPFLGKIPGVGWFFTQQNVAKNKRELLIFVTPKVC